MLKAAGLILIVISGAGAGFAMSHELTRREQALSMLLRMVICLKGEIRCGGVSLSDAFLGAGEKLPGSYGDFLRTVGNRIRENAGDPLKEIFRECGQPFLGELGLTEEEQNGFFSLGGYLGYLDMDMQIKQITLYEQELELHIQDTRREFPGKKKVYQSLGLLGGLMLAILVW